MIKGLCRYFFAALMAVALAGCVYDFMPEGDDIQGLDEPLVVIEGDIIIGGITEVELKSTRPVAGDGVHAGIDFYGANVWVESQEGKVWSGEPNLFETGRFTINTGDAHVGGSYRLCVSIPGRGEYNSAFRPVMVAPQIDSVTYTVAEDHSVLQVEVSTHNDSAEPLYCRWTFTEDWESNSEIVPYLGVIKYQNGVGLYDITDQEQEAMTRCFSKGKSNDIYIADTEKLSSNVILKERLNVLEKQDRRLSSLYAVTVMQTAMDKEAYQYWKAVKAGTSGTGGLFAPMPNEVRGNIVSSTHPDEIVLGFINVSTATKARKFINGWEVMMFSVTCGEQPYPKAEWRDVASAGYLPVRYQETPEGDENRNAAYWTSRQCADCRAYSNSTRPDFWPEGR